MRKPDGVEEFDGYPMPSIPPGRKPLPKEEEDRILQEIHERNREILASQDEKERKVV